jgi:phage FluMu protein Com
MELTIDKKSVISNESDTKPVFMQEEELIAQCPECKTIETIYFSNGKLVSTRKFYSSNSRIYHRCGSNEACRLY